MPKRDNAEIAARVRAALSYANVKITEKGKPRDVGAISGPTMARIVSPTSPRGANDDELREIADACEGVPLAFLQLGFGPLEQPISDIEREVRELRIDVMGRLAENEAGLRQLAAAARRKPPGDLGRRASGSGSKGQSPKRSPKKRAADGSPDSGP